MGRQGAAQIWRWISLAAASRYAVAEDLRRDLQHPMR
jgi:hypothetical protein